MDRRRQSRVFVDLPVQIWGMDSFFPSVHSARKSATTSAAVARLFNVWTPA